MNVLFLDDDPARIRLARRAFIGHGLQIAETAGDAVKILRMAPSPFDLVSLDHDLGGKQMAESDENSGYAVAAWIEEKTATTFWKPPTIQLAPIE